MSSPPDDDSPPLPCLPARAKESHKGDYGRALLIGGSRGMSGAIALAGMAALRSGAGLVRLAVPDRCLETVASFEPSYMTVPLIADSNGRMLVAAKDAISQLADEANGVACGPGLGRSAQLCELVSWMYQVFPQPLVLDADALYALAQCRDRLDEPAGPRILTPHAGEFHRFLDVGDLSRDDLERLAVRKAAQWGVLIVLKGPRTMITDGETIYHNRTGNPGMATGGSGDVLTGIITALFCQKLSPLEAARLGVYVHGLAGDLAARAVGQVGMVASDLIRFLPPAFLQLPTG
ncbi:MAG: NAD(P)H-hydrate dehydratase [Pirellulaceae bacterium]